MSNFSSDSYNCEICNCRILIQIVIISLDVDIPDVRHVINFDLPKGIDDYVHRIGRTGRVGNQGKATSFYDAEQVITHFLLAATLCDQQPFNGFRV